VKDRRWVRGIFSLGVLTALVVLAAGGCAKKTPALSLLVWEGYADPSYLRAFEESQHCKISASYMGSSDELVAKLRGGSASNYDVISPSSDVATMIVSHDPMTAAYADRALALRDGRLSDYRPDSPAPVLAA